MSKDNKRIQALIIVLIIVSMLNLAVGIGNTLKINTYLDSPAVIIDTTPSTTQQYTEPAEIATIPPSTEVDTTEIITETTTEATTETTHTTTETTKASTTETTVATTSATPNPTTTVSADSENESYCYVTSSGTKYHKEGCSYLKKSKTQMTVSEAKSSGYSPCSRCY